MASIARGISRLWVGNLPWTVSKHELTQYFSQYGRIREANVVFNNATGMSKGYGFVRFDNERSMDDVFAKGNHILEGRQIIVKGSTFVKEKSSQERAEDSS